MRCKYCGSSVEENDAFCQTCGRSLSPDADPIQPESPVTVTDPSFVTRNDLEEAAKNARNANAIVSLVLGIISMFMCSMLIAPAAVITGILGLKSNKRGMAIAGIVLGIVSLVLYVVILIAVIVMSVAEGGLYGDLGSFGF